MALRIGINGFGRIGRLVLRAGLDRPDLEFVAVNDVTDAKTLAHLLKYDSVHGRVPAQVTIRDDGFAVNGRAIKVLSVLEPGQLPWQELGVDIVVEATGRFTSHEKCEPHLAAGAKRVIITAPAKGGKAVPSIVMGVNEQTLNPETDRIVSNASCTTNCVVPVAKVVHEHFRIRHAYMTTIHAYTSDQRILDAPHKDLRRARAAAVSMIPTSTGAAKLIGVVFPELAGKVDGCAIRVPTADVSLVDLTCEVEAATTVKEVNEAFAAAAQGPLGRYLEYCEEPVVSIDLCGNPHSAIFDAGLTAVVDSRQVKVFAWYDNEWGYSCRVIDLIEFLGAKLAHAH
ncbi:MAG: type I glyceraldehyde-3-phosphate dehydrogenase [candidate division WOR-3 bacterium]